MKNAGGMLLRRTIYSLNITIYSVVIHAAIILYCFLISPVIPFIGLYSITFRSVSYEPIEIVYITSVGLNNVRWCELVKFTSALLPNNITI